jgi:hypothetical protein
MPVVVVPVQLSVVVLIAQVVQVVVVTVKRLQAPVIMEQLI